MMRLATLTSVGLLLTSASALAQGANTMTSGRPSAVLDNAQCQTVWKMASPDGATISQDQAVPFIVNFQMVDIDGDGKITADEFKAACGKGLVKNTKQ
jgi:EF hand